MALKIIRGVEPAAVRATLYGTEGIGKTTLAAQFPNPLILDTEEGSKRIDCAKVKCSDWRSLTAALIELGGNAQGFQTVVIDSIDWAEQLAIEEIKRTEGKHPDDIPYGRGTGMIADKIGSLLRQLNVIAGAGVNVLLVGHSTVKRCSPPDMEEGYDRFELKLRPKTAAIVKEWCDALLFANYKMRIVEGTDGKNRGKGGKERKIYAERCAAWDAKNRYGLAAELPMTIEALAPLFDGPPPASAEPRKGWLQRVNEATTVEQLGQIADDADVAVSSGDLSPTQRDRLDAQIKARHDQLEPQEVTDGVA